MAQQKVDVSKLKVGGKAAATPSSIPLILITADGTVLCEVQLSAEPRLSTGGKPFYDLYGIRFVHPGTGDTVRPYGGGTFPLWTAR